MYKPQKIQKIDWIGAGHRKRQEENGSLERTKELLGGWTRMAGILLGAHSCPSFPGACAFAFFSVKLQGPSQICSQRSSEQRKGLSFNLCNFLPEPPSAAPQPALSLPLKGIHTLSLFPLINLDTIP